jgi:hypothetical protein
VSDLLLRLETARYLRIQAEACWEMKSPLYASLLEKTATDVEESGPAWEVLAEATEAAVALPRWGSLPLQLMAAVHRLTLEGRAPGLAPFYPSVGGSAAADGAWPAFRAVLAEHRDELRGLVTRSCQTNEVGRSAALLGGFLLVTAETGLPLRLLEIGTSAGLNLRWDHFRYESRHGAWGDPTSPVRLVDVWESPPPGLSVNPKVLQRFGCDPRPVDPVSDEGRLTLTAAVWADQVERLDRLRGAMEIASRVPARVDRASAGDWLPEVLARPTPGAATVVFHTVMQEYMTADDRRAAFESIRSAGNRATSDAPVAWLRLEPEPDFDTYPVDLAIWPGGLERRLATAHPHGAWVRWRSIEQGGSSLC